MVPHMHLYVGLSNVYLGNGDAMIIFHTGTIPLSLGSSNFYLRNTFSILELHKNILHAARFTTTI